MTLPSRAACVLLGMLAGPAWSCGTAEEPCTVPAGGYRVQPPAAWNGTDPMGLLLYVHGYRGSAAAILADPAIGPVASRAGMLLVAPEGLNATWSHVGSPTQARDDVAFLRAVVADAKRRWPVDPNLVVAAGFSQGGSMVWDLACHAAEGFTAFLPFSGAFWEPLPTACPSAPVNMRHVHGTSDRVVPMEGRAIRQVFRQGDLFRGMAIRRGAGRCAVQPDEHVDEAGGLRCKIWSSCESGRLQLCLHAGGHDLEAVWLDGGIAWARGLTGR